MSLATNRIAILTYHSVDESGSVLSVHPDALVRQMARLAELGYRCAPLDRVLAERRDRGRWPDRTVVITFDDGYENNLRVAQPVLERHGFTATLYAITGHIGGSHSWEPPPPGLGRQRILDWQQVAELADAGWEIGAHTRTHPDLREQTALELEREIVGSRENIEQRLGRPVATFAYPGGHTCVAATAVVAREFAAGCTTLLRRATGRDEPHSLPRIDMYYLRDPARLERLVTGQLDPYLTLRRWARRLRSTLTG